MLPSVVYLDQTLEFLHLTVVTGPTLLAETLLPRFEATLAR